MDAGRAIGLVMLFGSVVALGLMNYEAAGMLEQVNGLVDKVDRVDERVTRIERAVGTLPTQQVK